jgi:signal transduction histidine kinase/ligand-binding sensor domain-containing protein
MAALAVSTALSAERLPIRLYTVADGLAGDTVRTFLEDSRGYLWIGTSSGLSRFGGQVFHSYDTRDGLPGPRVEILAETPDGAIWVATAEGVARLPTDATAVPGRRSFQSVPLPGPAPALVGGLFVLSDGRVWVASRGHWMVFEPPSPGQTEIGPAKPVELPEGWQHAIPLARGPNGEVWLGGDGILLWDGKRSKATFTLGPEHTPANAVSDLLFDAAGRLWLLNGAGELLVTWPDFARSVTAPALRTVARRARYPGELPQRPGEVVLYDQTNGLPSPFGLTLAASRDGVWLSSHEGAVHVGPRGVQVVGAAQGVRDAFVMSVHEDRNGTTWFGTESRGLARLRRSGLVTYDQSDGLEHDRISTLLESTDAGFLVNTRARDLARFDGHRFIPVTPRRLFTGPVAAGWGWNQFVLRDHRGRFWYPTGSGLFRYAAPANLDDLRGAVPERRISTAEGLPGNDVFRLYEDRRGDVWVSLIADPPLVRLIGGERLETVTEVKGGEQTWGAPTAFAEDLAGGLWMGFYLGGLARHDAGGWRFFGIEQGVPPGFVSDLTLDRRGRLWMTTYAGGVARIDDPTAERLEVHRYRVQEGLSSDSARCIAEGSDGAMYIGNSRGLDRLDVATGNLRSYSVDDGLPNNFVWTCHAARDGSLWFGTLHGLVRLDPGAEQHREVPGLLISAVKIAGTALPMPELGSSRISGLELDPAQTALEIDLEMVGLDQDAHVLLQHRLGDGAWSTPAETRTLSFAHLAPGRYEIEMRAVSRDGQPGAPARMSFRLPPPLRSRWWVKLGAGGLLALLGWALLRIRVGRLLAVERARTRIASDLHDDVGSGLSRIGMLGEIARRKLRDAPAETLEVLDQLGRETAELAESASEIIWSVDPQKDDFESVIVRLRRFAADLLEARDIALRFTAPAAAAQIALLPEVRRAVYLILKESIHNAARHSGARSVEVAIEVRDGRILARVEDDGRGIDPFRAREAEQDGHRGLPGLGRRAASVGGEVTVDSAPGGGTRIHLEVPLHRPRKVSHRHARRRPPAGDTTAAT